MANSKKKQVNFRLPSTLIESLKALAETESVSVTDLVVELLEQSLALRTQEPADSKTAIAPSIMGFSPNSVDLPASQKQLQKQIDQLAQELKTLRKRVETLESSDTEEAAKHPLELEPDTTSKDRSSSGAIPWL